MLYGGELEELAKRLVGKTIAKIEEPNAPEAICRFVLADGSAFRLHATDLGWWIEETAGTNGIYGSLDSLMKEYANHLYDLNLPYIDGYKENEPTMLEDDLSVIFVAPDEKEFEIKKSSLTDWEKKVLAHPIGKEKLCQGAGMGPLGWQSVFLPAWCKDGTFPKELMLEPDNH